MLAVKKHLDALRDGVSLLNDFDVELSASALDEVKRADQVVKHHFAQLYEVDEASVELTDAAARIADLLKGERPWRDIDSVRDDIEAIRDGYHQERHARLNQQELAAEGAREAIMVLPDFAALSPDQQTAVLRPIGAAKTETTQEALAPRLVALSEGFAAKLTKAKAEARAMLEGLAPREQGELVIRVSLELHDREIRSAADVDALLDEIRVRLLQQLDKSDKVRLRLT